MDRVLDRLWIGSVHDLVNGPPLRALGFSAVLDLRDGGPEGPADVRVLRLKNRDGDPWTEEEVTRALDFVYEGVREGRVLVACVAGMSRSASMVVGYLVRCGWDAPAAIEAVRRVRPRIVPVAKMLEAVLRASCMKRECEGEVEVKPRRLEDLGLGERVLKIREGS